MKKSIKTEEIVDQLLNEAVTQEKPAPVVEPLFDLLSAAHEQFPVEEGRHHCIYRADDGTLSLGLLENESWFTVRLDREFNWSDVKGEIREAKRRIKTGQLDESQSPVG